MFKIPLISTSKIGFRLSQVDILVIFLTGISTFFYPRNFLTPPSIDLFFQCLIPYIVANFFLFCNVFRVRTRYELYWLASATINTIFYLFYYENIYYFFLSQSCCTLVAILLELKSKTYHGVFANENSCSSPRS